MAKVETPYDALTYKLIGFSMDIHNELGPGLPEDIYKNAISLLLTENGIAFELEKTVPVSFRGRVMGTFRLDYVVEQKVIFEFKAIATLASIHEQQTLTYLSASGLPVALLINFGAAKLETKRIFPSQSVQSSQAYKSRQQK